MGSSGKRLHFQADLKCAEIFKEAAKEYVSTEVWSTLPSTKLLCKRAQGLIESEWPLRKNYAVRRTPGKKKSWDVVYHPSLERTTCKTPIPIYRRTRTVTMGKDRRLSCPCGSMNQIGLPCVHMNAVIVFEVEDYAGPSHFDTSVHWWKSYFHLAYRYDIETPGELDTLFEKLSHHDITGPLMPFAFDHESEPTTKNFWPESIFCEKTVISSIINYNDTDVKQILVNYGVIEKGLKQGECFGDASSFTGYIQESNLKSFGNRNSEEDVCLKPQHSND